MRSRWMSEWVPVFPAGERELSGSIGADRNPPSQVQEDYEVYIAPDSGIYEHGPGLLRVKKAPTLDDGRAFADYFIQRQLEEMDQSEAEPILLTRKKIV